MGASGMENATVIAQKIQRQFLMNNDLLVVVVGFPLKGKIIRHSSITSPYYRELYSSVCSANSMPNVCLRYHCLLSGRNSVAQTQI